MLDTHALIWAVQDNPKLGRAARERIELEASEDVILIPAICAWEIALVVGRRQVRLSFDTASWMRRVLNRPGYGLAPLEPEIAIASVELDWAHKDPADRMIVATALHWHAPLVTADRTIRTFAEARDFGVIDATA